MADSFDISNFMKKLAKPELYSGDKNQYVAIAYNGSERLALNIGAGAALAEVHEVKTQVVGLGLRLISIGSGEKFSKAFGLRGESTFQDLTNNYSVSGMRLLKEYLPLTTWPCSQSALRSETDLNAFPKLIEWITKKVSEVGGTMLLSNSDLFDVMVNSVSKFDESPCDPLFHLPGETPAWKTSKSISIKTKNMNSDDEAE